MGAALFPVLEKEIQGIDTTGVNGKALSQAEPTLQIIASRLGVAPLMEFYGADDAAIAEEVLDGAGMTVDELQSLGVKWFEAAEGLITVGALLQHLEENHENTANMVGVINDLRAIEEVLRGAAAAGVKWHLEVDF